MVSILFSPIMKHRFGVLLALQVLLLMVAAFAQGSLFQEEIFLFALLGVLIGNGLALLKGGRYFAQFIALATTAVIANLYEYYSPWPGADLLAAMVTSVFMVWVMLAMAARVFANTRVDENVILGAACLYVHIGMTFGYAYLLIDYFIPHSFSAGAMAGAPAEIGRYLNHFLYYSFTTLTTVGYGDIAPVSQPARYISVIESVAGQLYMAILVSRLVGIHLSRPRN